MAAPADAGVVLAGAEGIVEEAVADQAANEGVGRFSRNMQPTEQKPNAGLRLKRYEIALVGILLLAGCVWGYFQWQKQAGMAKISEAQQAAFSGDFAGAKDILAGALNNPDGSVQEDARGVLKVATFLGGEQADRLVAVRMIKEEYSRAPLREKVVLLNYIFSFFAASREPSLLDEVFKGEPFQSLRVAGDDSASLKNLAELSLTLYPTTIAYLQRATWDAAFVVSADKNVTRDMKKEHADAMLAYIAQAQELYSQEEKFLKDTVLARVEPMQYFSRLGYLFGVASAVYPEQLKNSEAAYAYLYAKYDSERDENGQHLPILATWLPHAYYSNALMLYYAGGSARNADVRARLESLVKVIEENPSIHKSVFLAYVASIKAQGSSSDSYKEAVRMAALSPVFKAFLNKNGWTL